VVIFEKYGRYQLTEHPAVTSVLDLVSASDVIDQALISQGRRPLRVNGRLVAGRCYLIFT